MASIATDITYLSENVNFEPRNTFRMKKKATTKIYSCSTHDGKTSVFTSETRAGRDDASFVACAVLSSGIISLPVSRRPPAPVLVLKVSNIANLKRVHCLFSNPGMGNTRKFGWKSGSAVLKTLTEFQSCIIGDFPALPYSFYSK